MKAGKELDVLVAKAVFGYDATYLAPHGYWVMSDKDGKVVGNLPPYSKDWLYAWRVVEHFRELWSKATDHLHGNQEFDPPFDDGAFFDVLHRNADRRWPWAFLYVTPEAICRAAITALHAWPDEG